MKVVVLLSGGMDSVTVLYAAARDHEISAAISFDYGSKHNARELPFAKRHAAALGIRHETVDLGFMDRIFTSDLLHSGAEVPDGHYEEESMKRTVVPFRNGIMLSIATGFAESIGSKGIVIVAWTPVTMPFTRIVAKNSWWRWLRPRGLEMYAKVEILRPFIEMDKAAIAGLGNDLGIKFGETWSCYKGGEQHCGTCGTCVERKEAFALAGLKDPTEYE